MKWFSNVAPALVMALVTCGVVVGYVQHADQSEANEKLNQFNQREAPQNDSIMTDDNVLLSYIKEYGPAPTSVSSYRHLKILGLNVITAHINLAA
jgi:hypothetical protein